MSRLPKRRKCRCCKRLFLPDPRTKGRQRFCSLEACQGASKAASQRRWLSKHGNGDYFRGPDEVERVQKWRRNHPGYWRREKRWQERTQVVENQPPNPVHSSCNVPRELPRTLQDECLTQTPAFVGLISMVTGSTLQEEIAATARQLLLRGRNILGLVSPEEPLTKTSAAL
jgi:hypothetical protein